MSSAALQPCRAQLWQAYREAFHEFTCRYEELESLKNSENEDREVVDKAVLALERARAYYRECRDSLALALLSSQPSKLTEVQAAQRPPDDSERVREIAHLLWEVKAGRGGSADDDWYRAEQIVRSAGAEDSRVAYAMSAS